MATESCEVVRCAGRCHRILWVGSDGTLLDHVDEDLELESAIDVKGERVLAALGGGRGCAGRFGIWRNLGIDDVGALAWRTSFADGGDIDVVRAVLPDDVLSRLQPTAMVEVR